MQSEVNQEENLNRIITVPNLLSFFRLCLIPVIIWSYCVKNNPLLAGEILLLSGLINRSARTGRSSSIRSSASDALPGRSV